MITNKEKSDQSNSEDTEVESELKEGILNCLDKELDSECRNYLKAYDIQKVCNSIEQKDLCYYKASIANTEPQFCNKIQNITLKKNCFKENDRLLKESGFIMGAE